MDDLNDFADGVRQEQVLLQRELRDFAATRPDEARDFEADLLKRQTAVRQTPLQALIAAIGFVVIVLAANIVRRVLETETPVAVRLVLAAGPFIAFARAGYAFHSIPKKYLELLKERRRALKAMSSQL